MTRLEHPYGTIDATYGMQLATMDPDLDGPIWMVNLMRYKQVATYASAGSVEESRISGREADDRYAPVEVLNDIGASVVFYGDVVGQRPDEPRWDRVGVVRYPTRRSFIDMQARRDFRAKHEHKAAGMEFTIVMGCLPADAEGLYEVEGTIIGDERRWRELELRRIADEVQMSVRPVIDGEDAIVLRVAASIDSMSATS